MDGFRAMDRGVFTVDVKRAREIIESPKMIRVTYRGQPVHLDQVYDTTGSVAVHYEDGRTTNAAASDLQEG